MQKQKIDRRQAKGNRSFFSTEAFIQQFTDEDMDVAMVYFPPGVRTKPHTHAHDQVLYIHEGRGMVATEQEKLEVEAGDVILFLQVSGPMPVPDTIRRWPIWRSRPQAFRIGMSRRRTGKQATQRRVIVMWNRF